MKGYAMVGILSIGFGFLLLAYSVYSFSLGYLAIEQSEPKQKINQLENERIIKTEQVVSYKDQPKKGERMGYLMLTLPDSQQRIPIYQGIDKKTLKHGIGHIQTSALPGEENNCVISGHRDTILWGIKEVQLGDTVSITNHLGQFTYKVTRIRIVDANDSTVIVKRPRATLTITTCYPFSFVGHAPQRYVVEGRLVGVNLAEEAKGESS